ncbi:MAG: carbohydrate ABC transporter permease [Clostridia bacterium]|nr:carbohydrate ABC transporter permease [Clostridia bacterium]
MSVIQDIELKSKKGKRLYIGIYILLAVMVIVQFFPMLWMFLGTFKTDPELTSTIPTMLPESWKFSNYVEAFEKYDIWKNLWNTVYIIVMSILIQVTNSIFSAYALSVMKPKFGNIVQMVFLATMMFSGTALMFPLYIQMTQMGLIGSKWALILSSSVWAYSITWFKSFFDNIPRDLFEAAKIDGASDLQILGRIVLPLSKPIISVMCVNSFMAIYNDTVYPLMLLPEQKDWTIMIRLFVLNTTGTPRPSHMYVLLVVATIPSLIIYMMAQKNLVEGVSTSGIKG